MSETTVVFEESAAPVAPRIVWIVAAAVIAGTLFAELLPEVFGKGEKAVWDWSFLYITLRFVLLPLISIVDLLIIIPIAYHRVRSRGIRGRRSILISGIIPLVFLLASYFFPVPWLP